MLIYLAISQVRLQDTILQGLTLVFSLYWWSKINSEIVGERINALISTSYVSNMQDKLINSRPNMLLQWILFCNYEMKTLLNIIFKLVSPNLYWVSIIYQALCWGPFLIVVDDTTETLTKNKQAKSRTLTNVQLGRVLCHNYAFLLML